MKMLEMLVLAANARLTAAEDAQKEMSVLYCDHSQS